MRKSAVRTALCRRSRLWVGADQVLQLLRKSTAKLDPSVLQRLKEVDEGSREAALLLARGGEHIERTIPDIAGRAHFLQEGGADTVAAVERWVRTRRRKHSGWTGHSRRVRRCAQGQSQAATLGQFGRIMTKGGDASWKFWNTYVRPHWKVWLATGALAAYLAAPDSFQNAAGQLTERGFSD